MPQSIYVTLGGLLERGFGHDAAMVLAGRDLICGGCVTAMPALAPFTQNIIELKLHIRLDVCPLILGSFLELLIKNRRPNQQGPID